MAASYTLYHYYETSIGPFRNLSELPHTEAELVQQQLRQQDASFAAKRAGDYLLMRRELESKMRTLFAQKGGCPTRSCPHYMIVEPCAWLHTWYAEVAFVEIPLANFLPHQVSFTYGDSFPAMRSQDGRSYRGQVYTMHELSDLIERYGLPQEWNSDGTKGPERYIEAQVWDDLPLRSFLI